MRFIKTLSNMVLLGVMLQPFASSFAAIAVAPSHLPALPTYKENAEDFFYSQQTSLSIFIKVPKKQIRARLGDTLDGLGFEIASFEDSTSGYFVVKPMVFSAEFGAQTASVPGTSSSTEVEFTILVYPKGYAPSSSETFSDFISGRNPKTTIGQLRLDVLCDNEVAVAAGRTSFHEHKFLGSFEYSYPSPNNLVGEPKPFKMDMTAYTWQGAGRSERKLFHIQADLAGLSSLPSRFSSELLFSVSPPEPSASETQKAVGEFRHYSNTLSAYLVSPGHEQFSISYGEGQGAEPLKPVAPFGDGKAIAGSETWPTEMKDRISALISSGSVVGYQLFRSPSSEYETRPFEIQP